MSFLAPLFLLGALAVAAPIIFHLIRRTTRERLPFSSLMFLHPTPPRITRRSRLENILLLILRCLVLGLLAFGFARPLIQKPVQAGPGAEASKRIVVLVDSSASMRRERLWADAQTKAQDILRAASPVDQVALFAFDRQVRRLVTFEQWSATSAGDRAALASKQLAGLTPSWADTHLGNALIAAAEALEEASKQEQAGGARRIVVISDLQEGGRLDGLQGYEWPRGIELSIEPLKARRPTNAGLRWVTDRDEADQASADTPARVRVSNSSDARREQFQVGWAASATKGFLGASVDVYVPPGQSRVASLPKPPTELAQIRLTGDEEDFDNTVFLVSPKAEKVSILFLGADAEADPAQALYYLKRAFQQTRRQDVQVIARGPDAPLSPADMAGVPLLIMTDPVAEDRLKVAQQFLQDGKTVLFTLKSAAGAPALAKLAGIEQLPAEEAASDRYAILGRIDFEHPLLGPFADPRFSDFTKIHFWKHRTVAADKLPGARILARFDDGDAAWVQMPVGKGTLLILTSGWHPADSQLALSSKFVPLLYSILEQSGGLKAQLPQYVVGDTVRLPAESHAPAQKSVVRKPDGGQVELAAGETTFSQTDQPGLYTVASATAPFRFAVNLAPEESRTAPLSLEELERLGVPLKMQAALTAQDLARQRQLLQAAELENRQKLWRWLLVAALLVLLMETWLAGWLTRRAPVPEAVAKA
jgi:hypothetical protein